MSENNTASTSPRGAFPPQARSAPNHSPQQNQSEDQCEYDLSMLDDSTYESAPTASFGELAVGLCMSLAERSFNIAIRAPMDRIECLLQLRSELKRQGRLAEGDDYNGSPFRCIATCYRKQGIPGYWRGYLVRCASLFPLIMVNDLSGMLNPSFFSFFHSAGLPPLQCYLASTCTGYVFVSLFSHPIEVIQLKLSCELCSSGGINHQGGEEEDDECDDSALKLVTRIIRRDGVLGMWRGMHVSLASSALANIGFLALSEAAHTLCPGAFQGAVTEACSTFFIMCLASALIHPLHTIRRRMILTIGGKKKYRYSGIMDVLKTIRGEPHGLGGLFQGLPFFLARSSTNFIYALTMHLISSGCNK